MPLRHGTDRRTGLLNYRDHTYAVFQHREGEVVMLDGWRCSACGGSFDRRKKKEVHCVVVSENLTTGAYVRFHLDCCPAFLQRTARRAIVEDEALPEVFDTPPGMSGSEVTFPCASIEEMFATKGGGI